MKFIIYDTLPDDAKKIREEVFVKEQGFQNEFDEVDEKAVHIVLYDENIPIAVCRIYCENSAYVLGRLAVIKNYRGKNIGSLMLEKAEKYVHEKGGSEIVLHAQCRAAEFYKRSGFSEYGEIDYDEYCPHIHMRKLLYN